MNECGDQWGGGEGQQKVRSESSLFDIFSTEPSRTTREQEGCLALIRAYIFTSNVLNLSYVSIASGGCIKRLAAMTE